MNTKTFKFARKFSGLLMLALCCTSAWAFQDPAKEKIATDIALDPIPHDPTQAETNVTEVKVYNRLALPNNPQTEAEILQAVKNLINTLPEVFAGLSSSQLRVDYFSRTPGANLGTDMAYLNFKQVADTLDVVCVGVTVTIKWFLGKAYVVAFSGVLYPDLKNFRAVLLTADEAKSKIQQRLGPSQSSRQIKEDGRKVRWLKGAWEAVREYSLDGGMRAAVDQKGEVHIWENRLFTDITGNVHGRGVVFDPASTGDNLDDLDLRKLKVTLANGSSAYTNYLGNFTIPYAGASPIGISAELSGQWSEVIDCSFDISWRDGCNQGVNSLQFSGIANPGTAVDILFNPSGNFETSTSQVNGYYHTTVVHNYLVSRNVISPPNSGINIAIPTNVNLASSCNAFYTLSQPSINFFKESPACINTAYETVIYHEYGHFVDEMFGGIVPAQYGLSEGWGDVLATYITGQPILGEGFFKNSTPNYVRHAENNYIYSAHDLEPHTQGQAWMGFAWELRKKLIASLDASAGIALAEYLVIPVLMANSRNIPTAVLDVVLRDEDDMDPTNGTPHFTEISEAAMLHGLHAQLPATLPAPHSQLTNADLLMTAVSGPLRAVRGASINIANTVKNSGGNALLSSAVGFYLSPDATITTADIFLGRRSVAPLDRDASSIVSSAVTIPLSATPGNYYLGAIADYNNRIPESNESNNARAGNIINVEIGSGPADLVVSAVSSNLSTAMQGDNVIISYTLMNQGYTDISQYFYQSIYLSADANITTNDINISFDESIGLNVGQSIPRVVGALIPTHVPTGTYYVGVIADYDSQVIENNESNNNVAGNTIAITNTLPDLQASQISTQTSSIRIGMPFTVTNTVINQSNFNVGSSFNVSIVLTPTRNPVQSYFVIGTRQISSLDAGASNAHDTLVSISFIYPPGTYYLGIVVDHSLNPPNNNIIAESNESNNDLATIGTITVTP